MAKSEASEVINRPIEEVFAFVSNIEKWSQWNAEVVDWPTHGLGLPTVDTRSTIWSR
ncbi:MAG: SRPBCC family protein [Anaerolineae bacterium]